MFTLETQQQLQVTTHNTQHSISISEAAAGAHPQTQHNTTMATTTTTTESKTATLLHHISLETKTNASPYPRNRKKHQEKEQHAEQQKRMHKSRARPDTRSLWSVHEVAGIMRRHPVPVVLFLSLLFFMYVEYTIRMVGSLSPPLDLGFEVTKSLHAGLMARPALNSVLAALNTVFVGMQAAYIFWAILIERRPRAAIAALFMFTCRGILGCSTQLPLPEGFLGSGMDFPVGNVSFFLFFSGHVAGAVIASLDMRRVRRYKLAWTFDVLNLLQGIRLLASRGHYTIDLAVGVGAGILFDMFAGQYEERKKIKNSDHLVQRLQLPCTCKQALVAAAS